MAEYLQILYTDVVDTAINACQSSAVLVGRPTPINED